ncbi:unnamed protein product [Brachionus calyciflorus]|uniref:Ubiquitin-like domain-containing protein n=1 Tax=Brachionus calyciflorus TaxID=104777 RepID=A0A813QDF5_9BILA|nr:unnamed protein product [Brachionus calyciflorus]
MEIIVKSLYSSEIRVQVDSNTTIEQLMDKVDKALGIKITSKSLFFSGRVLDKNRKISDYGIQNGNVVDLMME